MGCAACMVRYPDLPPEPDLSLELPLWQAGLCAVAGIDEAGRGALAGPVVAAAIILPADADIAEALHGVRDSKEMTPSVRTLWSQCLRQVALAWGVGFISSAEIDNLGIVPSTQRAALLALQALAIPAEHLLLDYLFIPECPLPQTALIKGDARCLTIAAASILAKTARDAFMCEMDLQYPGYGFARHKGYGTQAHLQALTRLGPCEIHRRSFAPLNDYRFHAAA